MLGEERNTNRLPQRFRLMSKPISYIRSRWAALFPALLSATLTSCGAQQRADAAEAARGDSAATSAEARAFLATLSARQRDAATFPFDDPERIDWAYVPKSRAGLPLKSMNAGQRAAAFAVMATGLSERGARLAHGIIELEGILGELEGTMSSILLRRDPERYHLTLFVGPGSAPPWGWRFEGHHLSVNVTELGPHGQVVAPLFMGANPARVPGGPKAGQRLLAAEEDLAFELLRMLDAPQRARATLAAQTFGDIVTSMAPKVGTMSIAGLPAAEMTSAQQGQLRRLLEVYAGRMADSAARRQLQRIDEIGLEKATLLGGARILEHPVGCTMRGHDSRFIGNAELFEERAGRSEVLVVALAPHDHANERRCRHDIGEMKDVVLPRLVGRESRRHQTY